MLQWSDQFIPIFLTETEAVYGMKPAILQHQCLGLYTVQFLLSALLVFCLLPIQLYLIFCS